MGKRHPFNGDRGLALLIVVGVLGILAVLATAFVTMAQLERKASSQRLYATKARLLARSGIEDAVARLSAGQDASLATTGYGGEDWDASGGALSDFEVSQEVFKQGTPDVETCPVRHALRPSFFVGDGANVPAPRYRSVDGRQRGYSGALAGDKAPLGNFYALKVEDESAKINVNGGFLDTLDRDGDGIPDHRDPDVRPDPGDPKETGLGWNFQLARILNVLGTRFTPRIWSLGSRILQDRPQGGYPSVQSLAKTLGVSPDLLSPHLTVSSWADRAVLHPNAWDAQPGQDTLSGVKMARTPLRLEDSGRPPVNLNAASREVLTALFHDLTGLSWLRSDSPRRYEVPDVNVSVALADALIAYRNGEDLPGKPFKKWGVRPGPLKSWDQFSGFCDALVGSVIDVNQRPGLGAAVADLLKTNFDPNTVLNKQIPDQSLWRWVDKSDLTTWSTEGSLGPTGAFRIACVGRLTGLEGRLLAECSIDASVQVFLLLRHTTQEDFSAGRAALTEYLCLSRDSLERTAGAGASQAFWGGPQPGTGLAVMTYPEAPTAVTAGRPSRWEGHIGLATTEIAEGDPPTGGRLMFLHHFDDSWDADVGVEKGLRRDAIYNGMLQTDPAEACWPETGEPSTLYPDGLHAQEGRVPAWQAMGNLPPALTSGEVVLGNHGAALYWIKQPIRPGGGGGIHLGCVRVNPFNGLSQALLMGFGSAGIYTWVGGIVAENRQNVDLDEHVDGNERSYYVESDNGRQVLPGTYWQLIAFTWNTATSDMASDLFSSVHDARAPYVSVPTFYETPFPGGAENLTADAGVLLAAGGPRSWTQWGNFQFREQRFNQVLDELAVYDMGSMPQTAIEKTTACVDDLYKRGRYGKAAGGRHGAFLSAPLALEGRPLWVSWTATRPAVKRLEIRYNNGLSREVERPIDPVLADDAQGPRSWIEVGLVQLEGDLSTEPFLKLGETGGRLNCPQGLFRYRVDFLSRLEDPLNQPLLETPFFEDITFAYQPAGGARVIAWGCP